MSFFLLTGVTVKVFLVDIYTETIHPPISVRAYVVQTVEEFKLLLSQVRFSIKFRSLHLLCMCSTSLNVAVAEYLGLVHLFDCCNLLVKPRLLRYTCEGYKKKIL